MLATVARADDTYFRFMVTGPLTINGTITIGPPYPCPTEILGEGPMLALTGTFNGSPMTLLNPAPLDNCPNDAPNGTALSGFLLAGGRGLDPHSPPIVGVDGNDWKILFDDFPEPDPWTFVDLSGPEEGTTYSLPDNDVSITLESAPPLVTPEPSTGSLVFLGLTAFLLIEVARRCCAQPGR
jgi:hypothetical protein